MQLFVTPPDERGESIALGVGRAPDPFAVVGVPTGDVVTDVRVLADLKAYLTNPTTDLPLRLALSADGPVCTVVKAGDHVDVEVGYETGARTARYVAKGVADMVTALLDRLNEESSRPR